MYILFEHYTIRDLLVREAPGMVIALVIAELFYKFHSFVLECLAFLTTWLLLSLLLRRVLPERRHPAPPTHSDLPG
jgi:hypothetical protein